MVWRSLTVGPGLLRLSATFGPLAPGEIYWLLPKGLEVLLCPFDVPALVRRWRYLGCLCCVVGEGSRVGCGVGMLESYRAHASTIGMLDQRRIVCAGCEDMIGLLM